MYKVALLGMSDELNLFMQLRGPEQMHVVVIADFRYFSRVLIHRGLNIREVQILIINLNFLLLSSPHLQLSPSVPL